MLSHHVKLVSFLETKVKLPKMGALYLVVCPGWCFINLCNNKSGRTVLGWCLESFEVDIRFMSVQIIHIIPTKGTNLSFFGSFIYRMTNKKERTVM